MTPRIETSKEKKLVGLSRQMSYTANTTGLLWQQFMPRRKEIKNNLSADLISMQIFPPGFDFGPQTQFEKWATVEVSDFDQVPDQLKTFVLPAGEYAVFEYKGSSNDPRIFQYIFMEWLPKSGYELDNRPHFELLGAKYKNTSPDSEEEIWIPIKCVN
jgi:AraC family transcriptional regulator